MSWLAKPMIIQPVMTFSVGQIHIMNVSELTQRRNGNHFVGNLVSIKFQEHNEQFAEALTTNLSVATVGLDNGTKITCETFYVCERFHSSTIIYYAGKAKTMFNTK